MTLSRLLAGVLLVCSASALAQRQNGNWTFPAKSGPPDKSDVLLSEPWKFGTQPESANPGKSPLNRMQIDKFRIDPNGWASELEAKNSGEALRGDDRSGNDSLCYTIRTYVVARDGKDSDSTHPVTSSTCQPGSRYHVKTAEAHPAGKP